MTNLRTALLALHREDGLAAKIISRFGDDATGTFAGARPGGAAAPPFCGWSEKDVAWAQNILAWLRGTAANGDHREGGGEYVEELLPAGRVLWAPPEGMLPPGFNPKAAAASGGTASRSSDASTPRKEPTEVAPLAGVGRSQGARTSAMSQPGYTSPEAAAVEARVGSPYSWIHWVWWSAGRPSGSGGRGGTGATAEHPSAATEADSRYSPCRANATEAGEATELAERDADVVRRSPSVPGLVECANASHFNELQLGFANMWAHGPQAYAEALRASLHI